MTKTKRKSKPGRKVGAGERSKEDKTGALDYTSLFKPLPEWRQEVRERTAAYLQVHRMGEGLPPVLEHRLNTYSKRRDNDDEKLYNLIESYVEQIELKPGKEISEGSNIAYPARGQTMHGYSCVAWQGAAKVAGADQPYSSLKTIISLSSASLAYYTNMIREWQNDPEIFGSYMTGLCKDIDQSAEGLIKLSPQGQRVQSQNMLFGIHKRVFDVFQKLILWQLIDRSARKLKSFGMRDTGDEAMIDVLTKKGIRVEHMLLQQWGQAVLFVDRLALRVGIARGIGRQWYDPQPVETRFGLDYRLYHPIREIANKSPILEVLTRLSGSNTEGDWERWDSSFPRNLLEYEQMCKANPEYRGVISQHMEQLIGECAMSADFEMVAGSHFNDYDLSDRILINYVPNLPDREARKILQAIEIFRPPSSLYAVQDTQGNVDPNLSWKLWEIWDQRCYGLYGTSLNKLFNIIGSSGPLKPAWSPQLLNGHIENIHPHTSSYAQSGHSYARSQRSEMPLERVKTRAITDPSTEGEASLNVEKSSTPVGGKYTFKVNTKHMKFARRLFSKPGDEEAQGHMRWADIVQLMKRIGFKVNNIGGSIVCFEPPNQAGTPFNDHSPHPEATVGSDRYRSFGKRLTELYGWDITWFERGPTVLEKGVRTNR